MKERAHGAKLSALDSELKELLERAMGCSSSWEALWLENEHERLLEMRAGKRPSRFSETRQLELLSHALPLEQGLARAT